MKHSSYLLTAILAALVLAIPARTPAAETTDLAQSYEQRLAALEAELAALRQSVHSPAPGACCVPDDCCCDCPPTGWYGGAEVVFAKPMLKESFRASIADVTGTLSLVPYDYAYNATPRAWIGYVGPNQMGVRARYWKLNQDQGPDDFAADQVTFPGTQNVTIIFPAVIQTAPGDVLTVSNSISLQTLDLEGTLHFDGWGNYFVASAGLQYARIAQAFDATVSTGGIPDQFLNWDRKLEGVGPMAGIQVRRPLGCYGLEAFGGAQGALIFGKKDIHRFSIGGPPLEFGGPPTVNFDDADELLVTAQLQLGAQWSRPLAGGGDLFLRATYEGQIWTDSGGSALGYLGVEGFGLSVGIAK
jgi:hypothetical protein